MTTQGRRGPAPPSFRLDLLSNRGDLAHVFPERGTAAAVAALSLAGCGDNNGHGPIVTPQPPVGATLDACDTLASRISYRDAVITGAAPIAAGTLAIAGKPVGAHCHLTGQLTRRSSPVGGGDPPQNAMNLGIAVASSDAGHQAPTPFFGIDPQARLDYGYQAVGKLTAMAKNMIQTAYGKGPDRSCIDGCSNGGRHTMVAAARYADQYDGYLVGNPGYRPPASTATRLRSTPTWMPCWPASRPPAAPIRKMRCRSWCRRMPASSPP